MHSLELVTLSLLFTFSHTYAYVKPSCNARATFLKMQLEKSGFALYLDSLYEKSSKLKCPFFRRRTSDIVDGMASIWRFIVARHKSLPLYEAPGCAPIDNNSKLMNLPLDDLVGTIIQDWGRNGKGYYITGLLTKEIYRNDCLFDGPDPDMPVRGLRKYLSSASQLFDKKKSKAEIISVSLDREKREIHVAWRLEGVLNLPWHPAVKPWTGRTTYVLDGDNLVMSHIEKWDIPVVDAFVSTLFPALNYGAPPSPPLVVETPKASDMDDE